MDVPVDVRRLDAGEVDEALGILDLVFGPPSASPGARAAMEAAPGAWMIARRAGKAVGVVTSNDYGSAAFVAMLAVDPAHRRFGVGTRLVEALLARLEGDGVRTALLNAAAGAESLYRRLGFVETDRTCVFAREAQPPGDDALPEVPGGALSRALRLDALTCGCDRSAVLRDFAGRPHALVLADEDAYALARGPVLGPFAAGSPAAASRLLDRVLAKRPHLDRAFPPQANPHAAAVLEAHGFTCARTLAYMVRGKPSPFRRERIYSQASLGHG